MLEILGNVFFCFIIIAKEIFILKHYFYFCNFLDQKKLNHCVFLGGEFWFFFQEGHLWKRKKIDIHVFHF